MQTIIPNLTRIIAALIGLVWCSIEPSLNYIAVCFFALICDCYTAWRCNCRIYSRYREAIKRDPRCKIDGKLKSKKMAKMVKDFTVLILAIFLATMIDTVVLDFQSPLHLANYLAAIYCAVQFVSILENESTCNGAAWARVMQKIVADKTERHFNIKLKDLMKEEEEINGDGKPSSNSKATSDKAESTPREDESAPNNSEDDAEKTDDGADKSEDDADKASGANDAEDFEGDADPEPDKTN